MGVPGLASWISRNFRNAKKSITINTFTTMRASELASQEYPQITHLYLDANSLLHGAAADIYCYNTSVDNTVKAKEQTRENDILVYKKFLEKVVNVCNMMRPTDCIFLSLDGVAPVAKQAQQRQRRFISSFNRKDGMFDTCNITPGTEFMKNLNEYIANSIENSEFENMLTFPINELEIIYSSMEEEGEGEHKIVDYMRNYSKDNTRDESIYFYTLAKHCIYGIDGDLVMLSLSIATQINNIYLLRDDLYLKMLNSRNDKIITCETPYELIDITYIKNNLYKYIYYTRFGGKEPKYTIPPNDNLPISDFILAGFFIGNDFVPRINMFYTLEEGFNLMINVLRDMSQKNMFITESNNYYPSEYFKTFITKISSYEYDHLSSQIHTNKSLNDDSKFKDQTLLSSIVNKKLDFELYRQKYYKKVFKCKNIDSFTEDDIKKMCKQYIDVLLWILKYYLCGLNTCTNKNIMYTYHYPPLIIDLSKYYNYTHEEHATHEENVTEDNKDIIQLISVLPPKSLNLIQKKYHNIYKECINMNEILNVDYEGKTKEHMGISLLDFIDTNKIHEKLKLLN